MFLGQEFIIYDWFIIHFAENNGMAFGFEFGGRAGKYFLTIFRIVIVTLGIKYLYTITKNLIDKEMKKLYDYGSCSFLIGSRFGGLWSGVERAG